MKKLPQDLAYVHSTGEILSDGKNDWVTPKLKTNAVAEVMGDFGKRQDRMCNCGIHLEFVVDAAGKKKLVVADFCKDRMCPACQRRRSLVLFHQVKQICMAIREDHSTMRYLLLTLTVPNVPQERLSKEISHICKSWKKLSERVEFNKSVKGFFRAVEITYSVKRDDYHPHMHVLLAVPSSYFGLDYIKQTRWLELWQQATGYTEITQVDVRTIKPNPKRKGSDIESAAAEVAKYSTKQSDYISAIPHDKRQFKANKKVVKTLAKAIKGKRLVGFGGVFKDQLSILKLKDVESKEVDLIKVGDDDEQIDAVMKMVFHWNVGFSNYIN